MDDRLTEMYIKETCEAAIIVTFHPATAICINIQELEDSGGVWFTFPYCSTRMLEILVGKYNLMFQLLACTINATCLALINAAVPMKFTIAAVSCMIERNTGNIILDPDSIQLQV